MHTRRTARWAGALRSLWRRLTWGDRFLIAAVLAASVGFLPWLREGGLPGQAAVVRVGNEVIAEVPLGERRRFAVRGPLGETVIEVAAGKVRVVSDPGPQQLCVRQGWISRAGESLVCLPNRVVIQIPGPPPYDSVVK